MSLHKRPADSPPLKRSVFIYPRFPQALAASEARVCVFDLQAVRGLCSSSSGQERRRASYIPPTERLARLQAAAGFAGFAVEERAELVATNVLEIRFGAKLAVEHMRLTATLGWFFLKVLQKGRRRRRRRGRRNCARGMAVLTKPTRETARQSSCQNAVVGRRPRHQGASTRLGGKHGGVGVDAIVRVDVCVTKVDGFAGGCT